MTPFEDKISGTLKHGQKGRFRMEKGLYFHIYPKATQFSRPMVNAHLPGEKPTVP